MPIHIDPQHIEQLVKRQAEAEEMQKRFASPSTPAASQTELDPSLMAVLGAAADGLSTYQFLKRGTAQEDNAMFGGLENKPGLTAMSVTGTGLAAPLLGKLMKKKLPQGLIDAIVANIGGRSLAAAGANFDGAREPSFTQMSAALGQPELRHK